MGNEQILAEEAAKKRESVVYKQAQQAPQVQVTTTEPQFQHVSLPDSVTAFFGLSLTVALVAAVWLIQSVITVALGNWGIRMLKRVFGRA